MCLIYVSISICTSRNFFILLIGIMIFCFIDFWQVCECKIDQDNLIDVINKLKKKYYIYCWVGNIVLTFIVFPVLWWLDFESSIDVIYVNSMRQYIKIQRYNNKCYYNWRNLYKNITNSHDSLHVTFWSACDYIFRNYTSVT